MSEQVWKLPARFEDLALAEELNASLRLRRGRLDWSAVEHAEDEALQTLVAGLELDEISETLGAETMSSAIADRAVAIFASRSVAAPAKKKRTRAKKKGETPTAGDGPSVWAAPPSDPPAPPPTRPSSVPAPPPRRLLDAPPPRELRARLEDAVIRDLLGPVGGPNEEIVDRTVRDRYLVGMLAPRRIRIQAEEDDRLELERTGGSEDGATDSTVVAGATMFPSAIGLSFCVEGDAGPLRVIARWGRYRHGPSEVLQTETGKPRTVWKREQMEQTLELPALNDGAIEPIVLAVDDEKGTPQVVLRGVVNHLGSGFVVSLFLVNVQDEPDKRRDEAWLFQPELAVEGAKGGATFVSRARAEHAASGRDQDERLIAMMYRERVELATGHGVSVHATESPLDPRRAVRVETRTIPAAEVLVTESPTEEDEPKLRGLVLDMKELAETPRAELGRKLRALPDAYQDWIRRQRERLADPDARLEGCETDAALAIEHCERALARIRDGLALLAGNDHAAEAFRFANHAMWRQRVHGLHAEAVRQGRASTLEEHDIPQNRTWRTFQVAFVLINLDGVTNLHHPDRSDATRAVADLLWFPTGGGKTEAYLGLAAYTMALRRLQGEVAGRSGEHGVAVLMRYTLRLLTLQQFQRATALICACEMIRREAIAAGKPVWGHEPFRIGLWVGSRSTPNKTAHAAEALKRARNVGFQQGSPIGGIGTPVQLKNCPWCGSAIDPGRHVKVDPFKSGAGRTLTYCGDRYGNCPFSVRQAEREGLPVVVVDEEVYRRLPTLLIATVDKFAQMPWNGATQMLFGRVDAQCDRHGFGAPDLPDSDHPKRGALAGVKLRDHAPLRPPDLIIQDELHLISGPLGTLVGLYETAVDELCSWDVGGKRVRPKVIASTATIRRAQQQIKALFMRDVQVFPPQGLDASDSFFAKQRTSDIAPGRRYLGICANGRRLKAAIIRVYVAYLSAAQQLYEDYGQHVDPWMTLVGYFSSLRELAGTRRLVDDDITSRVRRMDRRGLASRQIRVTQELTSRLGSTEIPNLLDRLELRFDPAAEAERRTGARRGLRPIDVLLATNMVSVGVDVKRLGLMVVAGQPKNTAEYIQATSRVGRSHPGLVCTIYNWARPRDLSHYETFEHYHQTFYSHVEALSVTPFAPRALDRGLTALLVALVRLSEGRYAPNEAAALLDRTDPAVKHAVDTIVRRAELVEESKAVGHTVRQGLERRIDEWLAHAAPKPGGQKLGYKTKKDGVTKGLLEQAGTGRWSTFTCLNSLRDVEPSVDLVLEDHGLDDEGRPFVAGTR